MIELKSDWKETLEQHQAELCRDLLTEGVSFREAVYISDAAFTPLFDLGQARERIALRGTQP